MTLAFLLSVSLVVGAFSCKKKSEECIESMCRYSSYCDSVKCKCPSGLTGKYCDSIRMTGTWSKGKMLCSPSGADSNLSITVKKIAGDTTRLMIINLGGTDDTAIADMRVDGSSATFQNYIIHKAAGNDTVNGSITMFGYDNLVYVFSIRNNSAYRFFSCRTMYSH